MKYMCTKHNMNTNMLNINRYDVQSKMETMKINTHLINKNLITFYFSFFLFYQNKKNTNEMEIMTKHQTLLHPFLHHLRGLKGPNSKLPMIKRLEGCREEFIWVNVGNFGHIINKGNGLR